MFIICAETIDRASASNQNRSMKRLVGMLMLDVDEFAYDAGDRLLGTKHACDKAFGRFRLLGFVRERDRLEPGRPD